MNIVLYGASVLKEKSTVVEEINDELRTILDEMVELMRKAKGVGLAANQVGIAKRFFVLEIEDKVKKVINPEIVEFGEEIVEYEEGCLSIPEIYKKVNRPEMIKVKYQNENGETVEEELHDLWARAFQHEFDHIDGILFIDRLSIMNKRLVAKKLTVLKRDYEKGRIQIDEIDFAPETEFYICGVPLMVKDFMTKLRARGYSNIYVEAY